jgi:hypothetical protein
MAYQIRSFPIPDDLSDWEEVLQGLVRELGGLKKPQVITLPQFAKLWVLSEATSLPAAEAAREDIRRFLRRRLEVSAESHVFSQDVYQEFVFEHPNTDLDPRWLGRVVFEVFPEVPKKQIRIRGRRANVYLGLAFKPPEPPEETDRNGTQS